jgi:hypothetical protein
MPSPTRKVDLAGQIVTWSEGAEQLPGNWNWRPSEVRRNDHPPHLRGRAYCRFPKVCEDGGHVIAGNRKRRRHFARAARSSGYKSQQWPSLEPMQIIAVEAAMKP